MKNDSIEARVERSSLGTPKAVAARRTVTTAAASKIVKRSAATGRYVKRSGG